MLLRNDYIRLFGLHDMQQLFCHPRLGAPWEGFALEQTLRLVKPVEPYFWSTHSGAEIDLFFQKDGKRFGIEFKFNEAPTITKSMRSVLEDLQLDHLFIVYPGLLSYPVAESISVLSLADDLGKKQLLRHCGESPSPQENA